MVPSLGMWGEGGGGEGKLYHNTNSMGSDFLPDIIMFNGSITTVLIFRCGQVCHWKQELALTSSCCIDASTLSIAMIP